MSSSASASEPRVSKPIPRLGFGVYKVPVDETQRVVEDALEVGYRHIDTAAFYANERGVGRAIAASGVPRDELFVTTKVWNTDHGAARTRAAFDRSLDALGLATVDLYLIHWPVPSAGLAIETWHELERLHTEGRAASIGVSNFLPHHLAPLLAEAEVVPAVNQIEVNPYLQQRDVQMADAAAGIATAAWSPLARGHVLDDPALVAIARGYGVDVAAVVIAWHLARGLVVIPKTVSKERMLSNWNARDLVLEEHELAGVDALERGERSGSDPDRVA